MVLTAIEVIVALTTFFLSFACEGQGFAEIQQEMRTYGNFLGFPSEKFSGVRVWPPCYIVVKNIEVLVALTSFFCLLAVNASGFI